MCPSSLQVRWRPRGPSVLHYAAGPLPCYRTQSPHFLFIFSLLIFWEKFRSLNVRAARGYSCYPLQPSRCHCPPYPTPPQDSLRALQGRATQRDRDRSKCLSLLNIILIFGRVYTQPHNASDLFIDMTTVTEKLENRHYIFCRFVDLKISFCNKVLYAFYMSNCLIAEVRTHI